MIPLPLPQGGGGKIMIPYPCRKEEGKNHDPLPYPSPQGGGRKKS